MNPFSKALQLLKHVLIFLFLGMSAAQATTFTPAPDTPSVLYRIDDRDPDEVFRTGFMPWRLPEDPLASSSLWWHIQGNSVRDMRTIWVSATGSVSGVEYTLRDLARQREGFPTTQWVYEVTPNVQSYSAVWALQDSLATFYDLPPSVRDSRRIQNYSSYLMAFSRQDEWATRGGHAPRTILRAVQWSVSNGVWVPTGVVRPNPHFILSILPPPQDTNPLISALPPIVSVDDMVGYEEDVVVEVDDLGHQYLGASFLAAALSCAGSPSSFSTNTRSKAATCDTTRLTTIPAPSGSYPSKLAIITHDKNKWCFNPSAAAAYTTYEGYQMSLKVDTCTEDAANKATMDQLGRITFYTYGVNFCVTAPSTVTGGTSKWDYISLKPCDMLDPNQRWSLYKGKMYLGNTKMYIQDYNYYAMLSKDNSGYDSTLDVSRMNSDFFSKVSQFQDYQTEIKLGWVWQGTTYYPTDAPTQPWSTIYGAKTYYDQKTGNLMMVVSRGKIFQFFNTPALKCLVSKQFTSGSNWDWANWTDCKQRDKRGDDYSFYFQRNDTTKPVSGDTMKVGVFDLKDERLWSTGTGQSAGFFFTSKYDYSTKATKVFEISSKPYLRGMSLFSKNK